MKLMAAPYSMVYLYDGERPSNPLTRQTIDVGLAPSIADICCRIYRRSFQRCLLFAFGQLSYVLWCLFRIPR